MFSSKYVTSVLLVRSAEMYFFAVTDGKKTMEMMTFVINPDVFVNTSLLTFSTKIQTVISKVVNLGSDTFGKPIFQ